VGLASFRFPDKYKHLTSSWVFGLEHICIARGLLGCQLTSQFSSIVAIAISVAFIFFFAFCFAVANLWTGKKRWNDYMVGSVEVGVVLNVLLLIQGMLWARPTWGIWWTWGDVRLVFSFLMLLVFAGVLALRGLVEDPIRRATWTSVATIIAFVDVPIVYLSVKLMPDVHPSSIQLEPEMKLTLLAWFVTVTMLMAGVIHEQSTLNRRRRALDRPDAHGTAERPAAPAPHHGATA